MHASAVSAGAALEQSRPPKKRRHISINLPAACDKAADSPATPHGTHAAGRSPADDEVDREADENTGRSGTHRKQGAPQEADTASRLSSDDNNGTQEETPAQPQQVFAPSPGLKVKLKRQKL